MEASSDKREVKPESAQKILKDTARNQREDRAGDKQEVSQQRKAPGTQNVITQSTQRSNREKSNMEVEKITSAVEPECNISIREERVDKDLVKTGRRWLYVCIAWSMVSMGG